MPANLTTYDAVLKDNYGPGLRNAVNNKNAIITEATPNTEDIIGKRAVWAVHTGRSASTGARGESQALPSADAQEYSQVNDSLKYNYHTIKCTGPSMAATKGDEGAFIRELESELRNAEKDITSDRARQIFGQAKTDGTNLQSGVLAVLSADPGTGTTWTVATSSKSEMRYIFRKMKFDLVDPASGSVRSGGPYTVATVNQAAGTFTSVEAADASVASADYVVRSGNFGKEINGLRHLISSAKYAGVDPASVPEWGSVTDGSSTTPISETLLNEASEKVQTDGDGSEPDLWVCEFDQRRKLASQLQAQKRYDGMQTTLKAGFKALDIAQGRLIADKFCPVNTIFGIYTPEFARFILTDWTWDDDDGKVLYKALDDSDAVQARYKVYDQLAVTNRNSHVKITVSTPTF